MGYIYNFILGGISKSIDGIQRGEDGLYNIIVYIKHNYILQDCIKQHPLHYNFKNIIYKIQYSLLMLGYFYSQHFKLQIS